jgi:hypothetical protein
MSAESIIFDTLRGLVGDRVFPDVGPEGVARPYITFQQVGGASINFIDAAIPSKRNGRFQLNVWADTRLQAATLARQVEDALRGVTALQTTVLGSPVADYEEDTKLYGAMQDFSLWTD